MALTPYPVYFAHANGLPGPVYRKFLEGFHSHPVGYISRLGHGDFRVEKDWWPLVEELVADIRSTFTEPVIGIGHSLGGILMLWAAREYPELFRQVILLDPPMFTGSRKWAIAGVRMLGLSDRYIPPVAKTKRRRKTFPSREAARAYWQTRAFFQAFDPEVMEDYLLHGLEPDDQGGFRLSFRVEVEYQIFLHSPLWMGKLEVAVPSHFVYATAHDVLRREDVRNLRRMMPGTTFQAFEGGHVFPLEQPQEATATIERLFLRG